MATNLKEFSKRLRNAADAIDLVFQVSGTPEVARKIEKRVHWTQKPENRAKVLKMAKRGAQSRKAKTSA
jgi:hypothetical protein